jgi:hypothetical protein
VHIAANVTSQGHCVCDIVSAICIMSGCLRCLSGGRSDNCVRVGVSLTDVSFAVPKYDGIPSNMPSTSNYNPSLQNFTSVAYRER